MAAPGSTRRWIKQPDGTLRCDEHAQSFTPPASCTACITDPGPAPEVAPELEITFPPECEADVGAWRRLSRDADLLDVDLKELRALRTQVLAKNPSGGKTRAKSTNVVTDKVVRQAMTITNAIVKVTDAKTKAVRAIIQSASSHRRDQRMRQMLSIELAKLKKKSGVGGAR